MKFLIAISLCFVIVSGQQLIHRHPTLPVVGEKPSARIIGGANAIPGEFPYQVGLSVQINSFTYAWCGGSLIAKNYVLTAAHCTDGIWNAAVYLGATVRTDAQLTYYVDTNNILIHPDWDSRFLTNDISLIKIPSTEFSKYILPAQLPLENSGDYVGTIAVASGWGRTSDASYDVSNELKYADMVVITNEECTLTYGSDAVTSGNICVSTRNGHSTCTGDSGGPLVIKDTYIQIGLTSYGAMAGCEQQYPVAFTRLTKYLGWIQANIKQ